MKHGRTMTINFGNDDEGSDGTSARLAFACQVQRQFAKLLRFSKAGVDYNLTLAHGRDVGAPCEDLVAQDIAGW